MNIVICDDLQSDRDSLSEYVSRYFEEKNMEIELFKFESGEKLLDNFCDLKADIIFLDIYMGGKTGIDTARKIREIDQKCYIIFTTTSLEHAIESFEVKAVHYLLKPLDVDRVNEALERCSELFKEENKYIEIRSDRLSVRVCLKELIYAEVYGNLTLIHTQSGEVKSYIALSALEEQLSSEDFIRCHRSYLVNMKFIDKVESSEFLLSNGDAIPIRRQDKQEIKQKYADYMFEAVRRRNE